VKIVRYTALAGVLAGSLTLAGPGLGDPPEPATFVRDEPTGHRKAATDDEGFTAAPAPLRTIVAAISNGRRFGSNGCSSDMVRVADRFCVDRYEASMVDVGSGRPLSPYYPPTPRLIRSVENLFRDPSAFPEE
jgi:hypothetical protein